MARLDVTPTRMELSNLKKRLEIADRGYKLLKDKQDELMRQFIILIKENKELRTEVEEELEQSFRNFSLASSLMSSNMLESAVSFPKESISLKVEKKNVMSVHVPVIDFERERSDDEASIFPYGYLQTSSDLDDAIKKLYEMMPKLLKLAEVEKTCQLMADEIEKTRRRVNALEHRTIPDLEDTIYYIEMKLDEHERSTITRLIKVKDMLE